MTSSPPLPRALLLVSALLLGACQAAPATLKLTVSDERPMHVVGETRTFQAVAHDAEGQPVESPVLRWYSSAPEVASVENGVVVARKSGKTVVSVVAGRARASVEVVVSIPSSIDIRADSADFLEAGRSVPIKAVVKNELGKPLRDVPPAWQSSNESIARVEGGKLIGVSPGTATIMATVGPLSRSLPVQVVRSDFARMTVEPTHLVFERHGQRQQLTARAYNARGTVIDGVPFTWFSSDWTVVTVSPTGLVTAVGPGRTVVTATAGRRKAAAEVIVR